MKRFLIHATYKPSLIGVSVPFAELMRRNVTFIMQSKKSPTLEQIIEKAKEYKVFGNDFTHCSTTEIYSDYKNFEPPVPVPTTETK